MQFVSCLAQPDGEMVEYCMYPRTNAPNPGVVLLRQLVRGEL